MTTAYDPIYHGSIDTLSVPQVGARLRKTSSFELDRLTIPFRCKTSLISKLLPKTFSIPPDWFPAPGLFFMDYDTVSEEGLISQLTLNYMGCLNGVVPPMYYKTGFSLQSVSTSTDVVSLTMQYRSPGTTYQWYETVLPPDTPRYAGLISKTTALRNIQSYQVKNNDGTFPVLSSEYNRAVSSLAEANQVTQYESELIVPGKLWKCISTTSSMLLPV